MGYDANGQNYSARITALLNVDRSNQRQRRLAANLRTTLAFEPRRRQDIDVIFLAANANDGRLLAPQLEYYYAGDVPTVAISQIYDPRVARETRDLDRVIFPDVPWLITPSAEDAALRRTIASRWPLRDSTVPRFYGFGFDAYKIVESIYGEPFFTSIRGASGLLTMDVEGRIHRSLPFAQIRNGRPEPLVELPPSDVIDLDGPTSDDAIGQLPAPLTDDARLQTSR
jgi:uncharacterized protein